MNWTPFDNRTQEQKRVLWIGTNAERQQYVAWASRGFKKVFKAQVRAVADAITEAHTVDAIPALVDSVVSKTKPLLAAQYATVYNRVGLVFAQKTLSTVKANGNLRTEWERNVARYLDTQGAQRIVAVNETTKKRISQVVKQMTAEGRSVGQIAEEIDKQVQLEQIIANRSMVIAHTETISASNWGSLEGAKTSGAKVRKEWISTRDTAIRTIADGAQFDHLAMDGKTALLDDDFQVPTSSGGFEPMSFPGDPRGSAGDVINCRCVVGYQRV
jgi:ubiquinone biosynthesis protein UbiJ